MSSKTIKFKKLFEDAQLPVQGSEEAGCFDFFAHRIERKSAGKVIVYLGLATEFPHDYSMIIKPRSSFTMKGWVMQNSPAEIDSDYRGELQIRLQAIPVDYMDGQLLNDPLPFKVGERCCQAKLEQKVRVTFEEVSELSDTSRAEGGFGSTGK